MSSHPLALTQFAEVVSSSEDVTYEFASVQHYKLAMNALFNHPPCGRYEIVSITKVDIQPELQSELILNHPQGRFRITFEPNQRVILVVRYFKVLKNRRTGVTG